MTFLNFSQLSKSIFRSKSKKNTFLETKPNFYLTGKCFPLTGKYYPLINFYNGKQTQESLESGFPKTTFQEINAALTGFFTGFCLVCELIC
jgi:hypothetical protein